MKHRNGLMKKITAWFLVAVMLPTCVLAAFLCINSVKNELRAQAEEGHTLLNVVAENILGNAEMVENALEVLSLDSKVLELLGEKHQSAYSRLITQLYDVQKLQGQMRIFLFPLGAEVIIFATDEQVSESYWTVLHSSHVVNSADYRILQDSGKNALWVGIGMLYPEDTVSTLDNKKVLCYYRKIISGTTQKKEIGLLKCGIPMEKMFSVMDTQAFDGSMYAVMNGETVYRTLDAEPLPDNFQAVSQTKRGGKWYLVKPIDSMQLQLVLQFDYGKVIGRAIWAGLPQMFFALASGILLMIVARSFLHSIQRRLDQAVEMAREAQHGKMEITFPNPDQDEIGELIQSFNGLLKQLQETAKEKIAHEKEKKQALRLALQYQVNPHFLFNTLNWLQMGVETGMEEEKISDVIVLLGKLLRYNLKGESMAGLHEEIECMENYIQLMNMRQHEMIKLSHTLSGLSHDLQIMRFLLQPLCENAIQHGMKPGEALHIRLIGKMEGSDVVFTLENDGEMIPPEQVEQLNSNMKHSRNAQGIGLMNIAARLTLNYGPTAGMQLISKDGKTQVVMRFPAKKA